MRELSVASKFFSMMISFDDADRKDEKFSLKKGHTNDNSLKLEIDATNF